MGRIDEHTLISEITLNSHIIGEPITQCKAQNLMHQMVHKQSKPSVHTSYVLWCVKRVLIVKSQSRQLFPNALQ